jgi:transposase
MMILELHRQGVPITAIARRTGRDPKTIRKYIERGIEAPVYGPRSVGRPSKLRPISIICASVLPRSLISRQCG